jgi:hypothetical protein
MREAFDSPHDPLRKIRDFPIGGFRCSSSVVEHSLGKGEVESSILSCSTIRRLIFQGLNEIDFGAWRRSAQNDARTCARCVVFLKAFLGH